jgi:comEA protein
LSLGGLATILRQCPGFWHPPCYLNGVKQKKIKLRRLQMKLNQKLLAIVIIAIFSISMNTGLMAETKATKKGDLININTAPASELIKLPRVGEKIAARIIEYRQKNGKFKRVHDIMKVKGIGEKTFENFREKITI